MARADAYCYQSDNPDHVHLDLEIYRTVWREASALRDSGALVLEAGKIKCPVISFQGEYDSQSADGVEKSLSKHVKIFNMVRLEKCGHTPWIEKYAKDNFFRMLKDELRS